VPIYRLEPIDPTDSIWQAEGIKEAVLMEAADEQMARGRVAALAFSSMRRSSPRRPAAPSLWLFSSAASCILAADHPSVPTPAMAGRAADGR
jgi:hypothetical protein